MDKTFIYADESSQDSLQYMLLGGIAIKGQFLYEFQDAIEDLRLQTNMTKELKWTKVTNQKVEEYREFVDLFFNLSDEGKAAFHCMVLDTSKIKHKQFSGSYELGFYKFFYQLLLHGFGRRYAANSDLYVFLDQRQTGYKLDDLRTILNNGMKSRYGIDRRPFRLVEFADSKKTAAVQIADILLGAVGYLKNEHHLKADAKLAKIALSQHVMNKTKLKSGIPDTPYSQKAFTVWNFQLS